MLLVDRLCKVGLVVTDGNGRGKGLKAHASGMSDPSYVFPL